MKMNSILYNLYSKLKYAILYLPKHGNEFFLFPAWALKLSVCFCEANSTELSAHVFEVSSFLDSLALNFLRYFLSKY